MRDTALDLPPLESILPLDRPFTRSRLFAAGVQRAQLDRLVAGGRLRRLLRGVYGDATVPMDLQYRAAAAGLVLAEGAVASRRTAAWVWGVDVQAFGAPGEPVPLHRLRGRSGEEPSRHVHRVGDLLLTSPLRTALDLGAVDVPEVALATMDHLVGRGRLAHAALLAELASQSGAAARRVRGLAVQVDGRARDVAESVLRLRWHASRLPTPVPGHVVPARDATVRFALAIPERRFGVLVGSGAVPGAPGTRDLAWLRDAGWWVLTLPADRVLRGDPVLWCRHLEREWHQQLLADVG